MQTLLRSFLFFILLTKGNSLECETCADVGTNCMGRMKTCVEGQDTCIVVFLESIIDGKVLQTVVKGCAPSYKCSYPPKHMTIGKGKSIRTSLRCCTGKDCRLIVPPRYGKKEHTIDKDCATADICTSSAIELYFGSGRFMRTVVYCCIENLCKKIESKFPPIETRMNGKQCPACHVWSDTCKEEMVNCTGHNVYCFDVSSHSHAQTSSVDRTMKGCTTKSVCTSIRSGRSPILGNSDLIRRATCIPEVSRGSRCSGFLLPTFSGLLLLLKILV
uniref:phospholipase A2 inhibitor subunit gamma B-like isoform X3 n=1 Tax=Podarcis muralis TaxID=64176 RepID=UPI0010A09F1D|nr:phospholipase A2 inhibitor subunit gamma B-like isoform X3 [Podarcis muralis]XP_028598280.1 phospholipase A2 inhibitor subunit gamma B-like isoform X3 [Podarcis muralis]